KTKLIKERELFVADENAEGGYRVIDALPTDGTQLYTTKITGEGADAKREYVLFSVSWADVGSYYGGGYVDYETFTYDTDETVTVGEGADMKEFVVYTYTDADGNKVRLYELNGKYYASTAADAEEVSVDGLTDLKKSVVTSTVYKLADGKYYDAVSKPIAGTQNIVDVTGLTLKAVTQTKKANDKSVIIIDGTETVVNRYTNADGSVSVYKPEGVAGVLDTNFYNADGTVADTTGFAPKAVEYTYNVYSKTSTTVEGEEVTDYLYNRVVDGAETGFYSCDDKGIFTAVDATAAAGYTVETVSGKKYVVALTEDWGIDAQTTVKDKISKFVEVLTVVLKPLDAVFGLLLKGYDLQILPDEATGKGVISIKAGKDEDGQVFGSAYETALLELFVGLGFDSLNIEMTPAADYVADQSNTLSAIINPIVDFVYTLCDKPVQTLLTVIPAFSYFLSSNGPEIVVRDLLSPIFGLYNIAKPILGPILDGMIENTVAPMLGEILPAVKDAKTVDDIMGLFGTDGSGVVLAINKIISGLVIKAEDGQETEILQILPNTFLTDYARAAIDIEGKKPGAKVYYTIEGMLEKVCSRDYTLKDDDVIIDQQYMVNSETDVLEPNWKVDVVDSYIYLLSSVLSEGVLSVICDAAGIDLTNQDDIVATIIQSVIDTDEPGLVLADVIATLLGAYTIGEAEKLEGKPIELNNAVSTQGDTIPVQLDKIILGNLQKILKLVDDNVTIEGEIGDRIHAYATQTEPLTLEGVINGLLDELVYTNDLAGSLMGTLVQLLGGESLAATLGTVLPLVKDLAGIDLSPAAFATGDGALKRFITEAQNGKALEDLTWNDVYNAYKSAEVIYTVYTYTDENGNETTYYELGGKYYAAAGDETEAVFADGVTEAMLVKKVDAEGAQVTKAYLNLADSFTFIEADNAKADFIALLGDILTPLDKIIGFLFRGESLKLVVFKDAWNNASFGTDGAYDADDLDTDADDVSYALIEIKG
ncbi:MAG: hypothetical protein ACI4VI_02330, partial [Acutalibacteraceae bacterium]